jgi:FxsC-like protein
VRDDLASGKAKRARYFFLSYANSQRYGAQSPAVDPWLDQFFADLSHEVRTQAGAPPDAEVGFMDREPLSGDDWPVRLDRALAACRVFVPMYSRQYFESEHCGREWSAFIQRSSGGNPAAIVPAVWVPVAPELIPDVARSIPRDDAGVQAYTDHGFYGIIKLSRYRDSYATALAHLAGKIVAAAGRSPVAAGPVLDYPSLESAFGAASKGMPGGHPLHITIAAPSLSDLPHGRERSYYGPAALDWAPYWPQSPRAVAAYVSDLARALGYRPIVGDLLERGAALLSGKRPSAPELLIVDPWAAVQDQSRELLRRLDTTDTPWVQVAVPWNPQDAETTMVEAKLRVTLEETLPRKLAEGRATSALAVSGIPTLEDFTQVVPPLITTTVRQYHRYVNEDRPWADLGRIQELFHLGEIWPFS